MPKLTNRLPRKSTDAVSDDGAVVPKSCPTECSNGSVPILDVPFYITASHYRELKYFTAEFRGKVFQDCNIKTLYVQELSSDFIDAYNAEKKVKDFTKEHAGMECFGVEVAKNRTPISAPFPPVFQGYSTDCTEKQGLGENAPLAEAGLEPALP